MNPTEQKIVQVLQALGVDQATKDNFLKSIAGLSPEKQTGALQILIHEMERTMQLKKYQLVQLRNIQRRGNKIIENEERTTDLQNMENTIQNL